MILKDMETTSRGFNWKVQILQRLDNCTTHGICAIQGVGRRCDGKVIKEQQESTRND